MFCSGDELIDDRTPYSLLYLTNRPSDLPAELVGWCCCTVVLSYTQSQSPTSNQASKQPELWGGTQGLHKHEFWHRVQVWKKPIFLVFFLNFFEFFLGVKFLQKKFYKFFFLNFFIFYFTFLVHISSLSKFHLDKMLRSVWHYTRMHSLP
jgi:hypothetical protein